MPTRKRTDYLVVHVTATPPTMDIGAKEVRQMHLAQGWSDIGYHYVIRRSGLIQPGRGADQIGAHVQGFNSISLGVSLVGGVDTKGKPQDNATPAQYAALEKLLRTLSATYPKAKICGHRDLSPDRDHDGTIEPGEHLKACPCFDAIPWARSHGLPAAPIRGAWSQNTSLLPLPPSPSAANDKPAPTGPDARNVYLQGLLARAGYVFGPIDGIVGPRTAKAITAYQTYSGLLKTGTFDAATVKRLRARFEAPTAKAA